MINNHAVNILRRIMNASYIRIKNILDRLIAFFLIIILFPFLLIIALLVRLDVGKEIFFIQKRPGYKCKLFGLIKFRTMNSKKDRSGQLLPDYKRVTKFGKILRITSLDELPELINILKGDLSFIGPRPLLEKYLPLYSSTNIKRHDVKPGLSGWAQINGRNMLSWENKFKFDLWYVENQSFLFDLRILFLTFIKVFKMEGINSSNEITMKEFKGERK